MKNVKVIYIIGVPASGKTTILRRLREYFMKDSIEFSSGLCKGVMSIDGRYKAIGVFDGSKFEGTDKLSNSAIDDVIRYVRELDKNKMRSVVFIEGGRLFCSRFLLSVRATVLVIDAFPEIIEERHKQRGDSQSEVFLKGRRSKVDNMVKKYGLKHFWNNTEEDAERIFNIIRVAAEKYIENK